MSTDRPDIGVHLSQHEKGSFSPGILEDSTCFTFAYIFFGKESFHSEHMDVGWDSTNRR